MSGERTALEFTIHRALEFTIHRVRPAEPPKLQQRPLAHEFQLDGLTLSATK
jgi:hypothetical protein